MSGDSCNVDLDRPIEPPGELRGECPGDLPIQIRECGGVRRSFPASQGGDHRLKISALGSARRIAGTKLSLDADELLDLRGTDGADLALLDREGTRIQHVLADWDS